jgi:large conductance mechanosensitive channel
MGMMQEFKDFAMRGNVVDLAVGVIIGGAFGKIVTALVDNMLMPIIGLLTGGVDFSKLAYTLKAGEVIDGKDVAPVLLGYGQFINTIIQFTIIAFCLFMVIKAMNSMKKKEEAAPAAAPPAQEVLLREIRDALTKK